MRLIDADKLKETLLHYNYTTEHNQIFRYINEQPTAYDIDKVVEDLDEQGLLLRLPCKVGDTVYIISNARRFHNEIIPLKVHGINIRKDDFTVLAKNEKYIGYSISNLYGKKESVDWFLTKAEAEQKLKEMESETE